MATNEHAPHCVRLNAHLCTCDYEAKPIETPPPKLPTLQDAIKLTAVMVDNGADAREILAGLESLANQYDAELTRRKEGKTI